jgi:xanthine dehydrogenase accessory factor
MRPEIYDELKSALESDRLVLLATVVSGPGTGRQLLLRPAGESLGDLGSARLDEEVRARSQDLAAGFRSTKLALEVDGEAVEVFVEVHPPRAQLVVIGAVHVAIPLVALAKTLGLRTVVVDPRATFASPERFSHADLLLVDWPDEAFRKVPINEATYVAVLSHDLRIDLPALRLALRGPARYIGALGSRRTHEKRVAALEVDGLSAGEIARIHSPIGLDLGGRRAEEIALAILAEIVAVSHGIGFRPGPGAGRQVP